MKKSVFLLLGIALITAGCSLTPPQSAYRPQTTVRSYNNASQRNPQREKQYMLQKSVLAYTKAIKSSRERCNLTPEEVAHCFSRRMYGNTYDGANIVVRGDNWLFIIDGFCKTRGACKIIITDKNTRYNVDLWMDKDGFLTTDNPPAPY